jgi:hypothetical protein
MEEKLNKFINVVLVTWAPEETEVWEQIKDALAMAIQSVFPEPEERNEKYPPHNPLHLYAQDILGDTDETKLVYCSTDASPVEETVAEAIDKGARQVVVVPLVFALDSPLTAETPLHDIVPRLSRVESRYPDAEIVFLGPPFGRPEQIEELLRKIRKFEPDSVDLFRKVVSRGFKGDWAVFARFMEKLQEALPPETRIAIRGSVVTGCSYRTGKFFDALGEGTSDLDLVLIGEEVMTKWETEGFYIPGILTMPLNDQNTHFASWLNPVREKLQKLVDRPVHIQAMPEWLLELRTRVQKTPYLFLDT